MAELLKSKLLPALLAASLPLAVAPAMAAPAAVAAWSVNAAASKLSFQSSVGGAGFTGQFNRWTADIHFDPKKLAASSVLVKVDMASAKTGDGDRDSALPGADWFNTSRFAQASFACRTFKDLGGGRFAAMGTLTMRGVSRPLTLPFQLTIAGNQAKMNGTTTINRSQFGVGQGQFAGADTVPFDVHLTVSLVARRA